MDDVPAPRSAPPGEERLGSAIGRYRVAGILGQGGMATVYRAVHEQTGKQVAIKVLGPAYAAHPEMVVRFLNEARAAGLIRHPGIVDVFDQGVIDGAPYLVMEFIEGVSLQERMDQPLPVGEALRLCRDIALALAATHEKGVVHRDLKPSNVMLRRREPGAEEEVKLVDFGIAKLQLESVLGAGHAAPLRTRTGAFMGTPAYMAPEQWLRPREVKDRADVYSLGVMLFQMLAGRLPFQEDLLHMHLHEPPPALALLCPFLAPGLSQLVNAMLDKRPEARPDMLRVAEALQQWGGGVRPGSGLPGPLLDRSAATIDHQAPAGPGPVSEGGRPRRRPGPVLLLAAGALLVAAMTVVALRERPRPEPSPLPATREVAAAAPAPPAAELPASAAAAAARPAPAAEVPAASSPGASSGQRPEPAAAADLAPPAAPGGPPPAANRVRRRPTRPPADEVPLFR